MNIEQLNDNHFEEIKRLLLESSLPVDDISHAPVLFFGITESSKLIAMGGLELYQPHAILRSATVSGEYQSKGIGSKLCNFLEEKAREMNIEKLFLLTTTAADFFEKKGYKNIERSSCPENIRQSAEYQSLCPESATSLFKIL